MNLIRSLGLVSAIVLSVGAVAQTTPGPIDHTAHHAASEPAADNASLPLTEGEVRKVDKDTKKITIKHGEIKSLEMPGMTMLFQVKDPAMLDRVKPGDKVKFRAEMAGGAIVVTEIQLAK